MQLPLRKQIRLKNYDYSQNGYYFVTICAKDRRDLLTGITESIVKKKITQIPIYYPMVSIDIFVIMKNHIHMIIVIDNDTWKGPIKNRPLQNMGVGAESYSARHEPIKNRPAQDMHVGAESCSARHEYKRVTLPIVIRSFKSWVQCEMCAPIWQRGYYEHIIRNESALYRIREYIQNNPEKGKYDWMKLDK